MIELFQRRLGSAERARAAPAPPSPAALTQLEADATRVLDAIVATKSKQHVANFLVGQLSASAPTLCSSSVFRNALFAVHSLVDPNAHVARSVLGLSLVDDVMSRDVLGPACPSERHMNRVREIATLAYGTLARKTRDPALRQSIQRSLLQRAESHPHRQRRDDGSPLNVQHEYEFSTLVYALGNSGMAADETLQQRLVSFLSEAVSHPVLSVRSSAVYSLRHHGSQEARNVVRDSALHIEAPERFRRDAIHAFVFQNRDILNDAVRRGNRNAFLVLMEEMFRAPPSAEQDGEQELDVVMQWEGGEAGNGSLHSRNMARRAGHKHTARGAVGNAISLLEKLSLNISLGQSDPFGFDKQIGTDDMNLSISAMADNFLHLFLNPLGSAIEIKAEDQFLVTSNIFGDESIVFKAQFLLDAQLGFNLNVQLLKQLAELEELVKAFADGSFFTTAKTSLLSIVTHLGSMADFDVLLPDELVSWTATLTSCFLTFFLPCSQVCSLTRKRPLTISLLMWQASSFPATFSLSPTTLSVPLPSVPWCGILCFCSATASRSYPLFLMR